MANRANVRPVEGETRYGTARPGIRGVLYIQSGAKTGAAGNPSCILLDSCDTNGDVKTWAVWMPSTGALRRVEMGATRNIEDVITDELTSGAAV